VATNNIREKAAAMVANKEIITIDVYWNRITDKSKSSAWVTWQQIQESIAKMNSDYSSTNFQFRLAKVKTTKKASWINMDIDSRNEKRMKKV
jgi:hypothetical protein